ncbi:MAG TPA: aromatic acid exporter family protein [Firmicutes bacterium]|nr:aromatic acid exporter family protein [Bacillota bacterium]
MNHFPVGGRILKTAAAVTLAIFIAQQFNMERVPLAAIVALITVQKTFYHSLQKSMAKLGSVVLGGVLGTVFSYFFGISPLGYGLATLAAIYICLQLHWQENIVITTVTAILIILSGTDAPLMYSLQQILTGLIGAACALLINYLFTPNHRKEVIRKLQEVEIEMRQAIDFIIMEMLKPGCEDESFKSIIDKLDHNIEEGMETAKLLREEQRFIINRETDSDLFRRAFHVYHSQLSRLEEMHRLARRMPIKVPQAKPLARLFRIVQKMQYRHLSGRGSHYQVIEDLMDRLEESFAVMDLPKTREEFVSRASLFHLFQEIKRYYRRLQRIPAGLHKK